MKTFYFLISLLVTINVSAEEAKGEWQSSTLSDATIKKIQEATVEYKKCVGQQMQKKEYLDMDTRKATDEIMKQCETALGKSREVYLAEKIPAEIADRHLKQIRTRTTRSALQNLMFEQAARGAGKP